VVASNTSSLPEVTQGAALDVDPTDTAALGAAMLALAGDAALRARCAEAGRARARQLTWHDTAMQTAAVYRAVLSN
jgi:alpha-1,3-rhamnosyl/mannosyltransferase